jgi:hypothetical protein
LVEKYWKLIELYREGAPVNESGSTELYFILRITENQVLGNGGCNTFSGRYMGHDTFSIEENILVRRFPLYNSNDTNANPTGGTMQVKYKIVKSETGWIFEIDRIIEN